LQNAEIAYRMISINFRNIGDEVVDRITEQTHKLCGQEHVLLFCLSHDDCNGMVVRLGWKPYHANTPVEVCAQYMEDWHAGCTIGLVCTSMLNCCLDYPQVQLFYHLGIPWDSVNYGQAIGWLSQDRLHGESIIYFDPAKCHTIIGEDSFGQMAIHETLHDKDTCR
jgi:superfamily II DNA helicase RecQ